MSWPCDGTVQRAEGRGIVRAAIASDPAFAPAYAGLVDAYAFMSMEIQGIPSELRFRACGRPP